jgi:crotonobetainyl-CoA:carnitine CoA-transferase CaiB-like acyl-CoA transferase
MQVLDGIIAEWTRPRTVSDVDRLLQDAGVPGGGLYRAPEMLADPHFKARDAIIDTPTDEWPDLKMQNVFPKMSRTQGQVRWTGANELGAHNEEVYGDLLGLSSDDLARLRELSVV